MALTEQRQFQDRLSHLSPRDILQSGERVSRIEYIPLSAIATEESLIDESHARELGESIQKESQVSPITVRARVDEETGDIAYDIVDGFHRTAAMKSIDQEIAQASVIYGRTDEEMYGLRILAASSVTSVQFARVATWMKQSFGTTPWAAKGVTVTHAFAMAVNNSKRANNADLSPEEVTDIKQWVINSCKTWLRQPTTTYENLRLVEDSDPELVKKVRRSGGGKDREGVITPDRLKVVVQAFPGEENFPLQNAMLRFITENRLYASEAAEVTEFAQAYLRSGMDAQFAYDMLKAKIAVHRFKLSSKVPKEKKPSASKKLPVPEYFDEEDPRALQEMVVDISARLRGLEDEVVPQLKKQNEFLRQQNTALTDRNRQLEAEVLSLRRRNGTNVSTQRNGETIQQAPRQESHALNDNRTKLAQNDTLFVVPPTGEHSAPEAELHQTATVALEDAQGEEEAPTKRLPDISPLLDGFTPTILMSFIGQHWDEIETNGELPSPDDKLMDVLDMRYDSNLKLKGTKPKLNQSRVDGIESLQGLSKLEPDAFTEATAGLPPEILQLIDYARALNDAGVLEKLEGIAREGLRAELQKKK